MTYSRGGLIQAADFNDVINSSANIPVGINQIWTNGASGTITEFRQYGYGQPLIPGVNVGDTIASGGTQWQNMLSVMQSIASHQGTTLNWTGGHTMFPPAAGTKITWEQNLTTNITLLATNRFNADLQGGTTPNVATSTTTWSDKLSVTFTVTFANDLAIRSFFNAGGQLGIESSHPAGPGITMDTLISDLCSDAGTVWLSAPTSGTISLAGQTYSGVTKVGGSNPAGETINSNYGFHALTATSTQIFKQLSDTVFSPYGTDTFMSISASYNGTGKLTFVVLYDEVPNGALVSTGTVTTLIVRNPSTSVLSNSWGVPVLSNSSVTTDTCPMPVISSNLPATYVLINGTYNGSFTVSSATSLSNAVVTGAGAPGISAVISGLTVTVSGTPSVVGTFNVSVDAINACGGSLTTSTTTLTTRAIQVLNPSSLEVLVVGGGGGGGISTGAGSAGGGGGGVIAALFSSVGAGSYPVIVGAGGASGSAGGASSFTKSSIVLTSGGGGAGRTGSSLAGGVLSISDPTSSQTQAGSQGGPATADWAGVAGSGGGGATTSGYTWGGSKYTVNQGERGGTGYLINGAWFASGGGGGGSNYNDNVTNSGGWSAGVNGGNGNETSNQTPGNGADVGGRGASSFVVPVDATNAIANKGGGGGGAGGGGRGLPSAGGSGTVVLRYPGSVAIGTGGNIVIAGGYVYHTFTTSGTFTL
jgi:hypothetical protein